MPGVSPDVEGPRGIRIFTATLPAGGQLEHDIDWHNQTRRLGRLTITLGYPPALTMWPASRRLSSGLPVGWRFGRSRHWRMRPSAARQLFVR